MMPASLIQSSRYFWCGHTTGSSRRREHAVVYKDRLRDRGIRLVSISEPSDDTPSARFMDAIIEGLVECYSENLSEDDARGMREAALRGDFFGARAPSATGRSRSEAAMPACAERWKWTPAVAHCEVRGGLP